MKNQLSVDYANKPQMLAKETLFALYGKENFEKLHVTGRGQVAGSFTVHNNVQKAVCCK